MTFYDIGQELGSLKKVQLRKEQNPITKDKETSEEDFINEYGERKKNMIGELQYKDRRTLMRSMMRYNTRAERILNGVCKGRFPEERMVKKCDRKVREPLNLSHFYLSQL